MYLFRVNWQFDPSVAGADRIVWGFHLDDPDAVVKFSTYISGFETAFSTHMAANMPTLLEVESYQLYDVIVGGPPVAEALPAGVVAGTGAGVAPTEVQICVSRWVNDGLGRPFKKGRIYLGPLTVGVTDAPRPRTTDMQQCLDFSVAFHDSIVLAGSTPVVDTKGALHVPETIVQYSVDDAWDTQRRRGLDPTTELTAAV